MASRLLLWEVNADDAEQACFFGCKEVSRQLGISSHIQHKGISFLLGPGKHVSQLLGEVQALDVFYFVDCLSRWINPLKDAFVTQSMDDNLLADVPCVVLFVFGI